MPNSLTIEEILEKAMLDGHFPRASLFYPKHQHLDKGREIVLIIHTARPEQPSNYSFTYCTKEGFLLSLPGMIQNKRDIVLVCPYISYKSAAKAEEIYTEHKNTEKVRSFLSSA